MDVDLADPQPRRRHPAGGAPLALLRASLDEQRGCQLTALEDSCIATVGGSVMCFDLAGNLRWARRPLWIPPEADPHWLAQSHEPPLVAGDRCFIVQPGVLNFVCVEPESGRLHWQKAIVGLRRLAGLGSGRIIVRTDAACSVWMRPAARSCGGTRPGHGLGHGLQTLSGLCGGPGGLMYCRAKRFRARKSRRPSLVWVDLKTGHETTRFSLDDLQHARPRLGPLFVAGDRLWAFFGKGNDLTRDLVELVPTGQALPASPPATEWEAWRAMVPGPMHTAAARVLPGWNVFSSKHHPKMGLTTEFRGQRDVLCASAPFIIGRHFGACHGETAVAAAGRQRGQGGDA